MATGGCGESQEGAEVERITPGWGSRKRVSDVVRAKPGLAGWEGPSHQEGHGADCQWRGRAGANPHDKDGKNQVSGSSTALPRTWQGPWQEALLGLNSAQKTAG